jgi:glycosyltransferase involved in cell wall biosynthesis
MRIAVLNNFRRHVGGIETYLSAVLPELAAAGQELLFWCEHEGSLERPAIPLPQGAASCCAEDCGPEAAVRALRSWSPDVLFSQALGDAVLEETVQAAAPAVIVAHNYYGTCISGLKSHQFPTPRPCHRRFGPACLFCYYPLHCGGWSPHSMWRLYRSQARRLRLLHGYQGIITLSAHMRAEYLRHGWPPNRVWHLPCGLSRPPAATVPAGACRPDRPDGDAGPWRLLYVGRMEATKGGLLLLKALAEVPSRLNRPVRLTLAGDGDQRGEWEQVARRRQARTPGLTTEFLGWVSQERLAELFGQTDLLVVPSVWPEPLGLVGLEAGLRRVPAVAYAVGGIPDWLRDGVNGHLAPGDPPTAAGFAEAIVRCLRDGAHHARLRAGARARAALFPDPGTHARGVLGVLERVAGSGRPGNTSIKTSAL